ncbi:thiamine diphosphokinase [bacterium]|nr:thiamine diphosphokinase [bacterium]
MSENPAAVVVAGGQSPPLEWARPRLQRAPLVFCADSGLRLCLACQVLPHMLVGDLDSLTPQEVADLPDLRYGVERHSVHKDESDLHLTLKALARHYSGPVDILACLGGRLDHKLFNLCAILFLALDLGLQPRACQPDTLVFPLRDRLSLTGLSGQHCSILPLSDRLERVTLSGLRYPLQAESLHRRSTRGLSNVIESDLAHIQIDGGEGLVIVTPG